MYRVDWLLAVIRYGWASPNTLLGIGLGSVGLISGGRVQLCRGCCEFSGGVLPAILRRLPPRGVRAMTLGHAIIGTDPPALEDCRDHEHVHVRQYEVWGPFFLAAYLGCSAYLWLRRRDYYHENPFEVEAYAKDADRRK